MLPNNSVFYWENKFFWICTAQARILPLVELTQSCFSYQCNNKVRCLSSCWHIKSSFFLLTICPEGHGPWCSADFSLDKLCAVQQREPVKAAADTLNTSRFCFSKKYLPKKHVSDSAKSSMSVLWKINLWQFRMRSNTEATYTVWSSVLILHW